MDECVFCGLGRHLDQALYSDGTCFVVFDKFPAEKGHMLVISRVHSENMLAAPEEAVAHCFLVARKFAALCMEKLQATGVNVTTNIGKGAGQIIPHFHIHVIPRYPLSKRDVRYFGRAEMPPEESAMLAAQLGLHNQ